MCFRKGAQEDKQRLVTCIKPPYLIICTAVFEMSVAPLAIEISMLKSVAIMLSIKD